MVVNGLKFPVAELGQNGEHVEGAAVPHVQVVGFLVVLTSSPVVGGPAHLLLVARKVSQAEQVLLSGDQRHPADDRRYGKYARLAMIQIL